MDALQAHIQSYGNAMDSLESYKRMADQKFVDDWYKENVEVPKAKIEALAKGAEFTGGAIEGTKVLKGAGQYFAKKLKGGTEEQDTSTTTEDDSGAGGAGDESAGASASSNPRTGADDAGTGDSGLSTGTDAVEASENPFSFGAFQQGRGAFAGQVSRPDTEGMGDELGGEFASDPVFSTPRPLTGQSLTRPPPQTASSTGAQSAPDPTSGGNSATGNHNGPDGDSGDLEPSAEGPTLEGAPQSVIERAGTDLAPEVEEGAGGALDAVVGGLGTAMDFLGPLGLLAGIGLDLYEAFHKSPKPPKPPQAVSNRTQGSLVLPTYDSVQDTPASASAF